MGFIDTMKSEGHAVESICRVLREQGCQVAARTYRAWRAGRPAAGDGELRPGLMAAGVGLHFIPFAWAFNERMFFWLGGLVCGLGATGLLAGALGVAHAAEALAVLSGLVMLIVITVYARGRFAPAALPGN